MKKREGRGGGGDAGFGNNTDFCVVKMKLKRLNRLIRNTGMKRCAKSKSKTGSVYL